MFVDYYSKYLSIDAGISFNNCLICKSPNRDIPLNQRFSYKIIITEYYGWRVVSVSPSIADDTISNICTNMKDRDFNEVLQSMQLLNSGYRISKMYRMTRNSDIILENKRGKLEAEYLSDYSKYVISVSGL
jgi:hypothetical protein